MHRWSSSLLGLTLLISLLPAPALAGDADTGAVLDPSLLPETPKFAGMTFWHGMLGRHDDFKKEVGYHPRFRQLIRNIDWNWGDELAGLTETAGNGTVTWIETQVNDDLDAFNSGAYDSDLADMVSTLASWLDADSSRRLVIAPFVEPNLPHLWGGDPDGYQGAFIRVHDAFRDGGVGPDKVRFAFVMNGVGAQNMSYDRFYPGDEYVDILGFHRLNRGNPWIGYDEVFGGALDQLFDHVSVTKPIVVSQTGTVDGSQRDEWLADMFDGLAANDQVIGFIYWSRLDGGGTLPDFDVFDDSGNLDAMFRQKAREAAWRNPGETTDWIFDGGMDQWEAQRHQVLYGGIDPGSLTCHGLPVTLTGTIWDDDLTGTPNADVIHMLGGDDEVEGLDGDDTICGGEGKDHVFGNDGDDWIDGGERNDFLEGYNGNDTLIGGDGNDRLDGGTGDDLLRGKDGDDLMWGRAGSDTLAGGWGSDEIYGGPDDDVLRGQPGSDLMFGEGGEDKLVGQRGDDQMDGGSDDDVLKGGPGDDSLLGSGGDDKLRGQGGRDSLDGQGDKDLVVGGADDDMLWGNLGDDNLRGNSGNDELRGGAGSDWVHGGSGADLCYGESVHACE